MTDHGMNIYSGPQYFETGKVTDEDHALQYRLTRRVRDQGIAGRWPLITQVLEHPTNFKIKSPIRQEVMNLVGRTMEKLGFSGTPKDERILDQLFKWMKIEEQKGELF